MQTQGCSASNSAARAIHLLIWNLAEVNEKAMFKMCELVQNGKLPCYLLAKSIFENNFRYVHVAGFISKMDYRAFLHLTITYINPHCFPHLFGAWIGFRDNCFSGFQNSAVVAM